MYTPAFELKSFDTWPLSQRLDVIRAFLEALIVADRIWIRTNKPPPMYTAGLKYKLKVRPFGLDTWQDIPRTIELQGGDCKDFACWRVAELREANIPDVSPRIKVMTANGLIVYHIQVRRDLELEDPSAILGMPSMTAAQVQNLIRGPSTGVQGILQSQGRTR